MSDGAAASRPHREPADAPPGASGTTERSTPADALGDLDRRILAFESRSFADPGAKAEAVRAEFGISAARYYRILGGLIDSPAALRHDPMLVKRLQRMRDARAAARSRRTLSLGRSID
ncbi:DUF3263 domain-containing protein [Agromyces sp. G08B096]|uniref:DUF3263 domain-containing protein n=1 Tax=Agromyces sp. G08B096 TaxID=3156399 RepID=A0AAU7WA17_9MICO